MPPKNHIAALTIARGIAALWVLAHNDGYFREHSGIDTSTGILAKGYLAVDFFLLLSGFLLGFLYSSKIAEAATGRYATYQHFVLNRLARIYPLYLFLLCVRVGIETLKYLAGVEADFQGPAPFDDVNSIPALLANAAMVQAWGYYDQPTWVPSFWSVSAEWFAYLIFPFMVWCCYRQWQKPMIATSAIAFALLLLVIGIGVHGDVEFPVRFSLIRCVPEFIIGVIVAIHWDRIQPRVAKSSPFAMVTIAVTTILLASHFQWNDVIPVLAAIPLLVGLATTGAPLSIKPSEDQTERGSGIAQTLIYLGKISYAIYLSHLIVQSGYRIFETKFFGEPSVMSAWLGFGVRLGIILAGSAALYHLVELPARSRIRSWLDRKYSQSSSPSQNGS